METTEPVDYSNAIKIIAQWRNILNARLLATLSLIGAVVIFGLVVYSPTTLRLWGASLYSVGVFWPLVFLYMTKG